MRVGPRLHVTTPLLELVQRALVGCSMSRTLRSFFLDMCTSKKPWIPKKGKKKKEHKKSLRVVWDAGGQKYADSRINFRQMLMSPPLSPSLHTRSQPSLPLSVDVNTVTASCRRLTCQDPSHGNGTVLIEAAPSPDASPHAFHERRCVKCP